MFILVFGIVSVAVTVVVFAVFNRYESEETVKSHRRYEAFVNSVLNVLGESRVRIELKLSEAEVAEAFAGDVDNVCSADFELSVNLFLIFAGILSKSFF